MENTRSVDVFHVLISEAFTNFETTHENHLVSSPGIIRVLCIDQHNFQKHVSDSSILGAAVVLLGKRSFFNKSLSTCHLMGCKLV